MRLTPTATRYDAGDKREVPPSSAEPDLPGARSHTDGARGPGAGEKLHASSLPYTRRPGSGSTRGRCAPLSSLQVGPTAPLTLF